MRLKSIKINGFKSFADKTEIEFKTDITAVVGPNGSGKSNIVDAVRWVLGEQSVKSLRGTNSMNDCIFQGSEKRNASKRCEVTLTFDNSTKFLNTDLSEVEIKRILYSSGENEYYINNSKVKLKDITNILLDSGIGINSFNIISQGNIEEIIKSKPIDRRTILENASGVLKYKNRKIESIKKLDKTKDNISKIELVINELKTSLEPLKKQSEDAKLYLSYQNDLKDLDIALAVYDIDNIKKDYDKLNEEIDELEKEKLGIETSSNKANNDIEVLNKESLDLEAKINKLNDDILVIKDSISKKNNELSLLKEKEKLNIKKDSLKDNIIKSKEEEVSLTSSLEKEKFHLNELLSSLKELENNLKKINNELTIKEVTNIKEENELNSKKKDYYNLSLEIKALENSIRNNDFMPYAVKNILNNPRLKGINDVISKLISYEDLYDTAITTALGASRNFIVTDNEENARDAINYLKKEKLGRATFFPLNIIKSRKINNIKLDKEDGYIGIASDLVKYDLKYSNIIENVLGNIIIVNSVDDFKNVGNKTNHLYKLVSLSGDVMHPGGSLTGGFNNNTTSDNISLKNKKKEFENLEKDIEKLNMKIDQYNSFKITNKQAEEKLLKDISIKNNEIYNVKINISNLENHLNNIKDVIKSSNSLLEDNISKDLLSILDSIKEEEIELEKNIASLNMYKNKKSDISSKIALLNKEYHDQNSKVYKVNESLKNKQIEISKYDTKMDYLLNLLNEEYHLTYEKASNTYSLDIDSNLAREKVKVLRSKIKALGMVNLGSISEYERINERYTFLDKQRKDLEDSSNDLLGVITEMDKIMEERLIDSFKKINEEFKKTFNKLFNGGHGELVLTSDNILETGIDIIASPPGKSLNNINLLSGGEKTLTAISLLFAILNVYPVPFCILDEVEAALDEANVERFGKFLNELKEKSEFILITHKKKTMEYANTLYGITMEEKGVSKVVSVKLD